MSIPLEWLKLDRRSAINLGDSKIIPWTNVSKNLKGKIKLLTQNNYNYILQIPNREKEPPRKTLDRALTVFKLFKDQLVLADYIFGEACLIDRLPHYVYWEYEERKDPMFHLRLKEENEFCDFWKKFIEVNPGNFSVYRFHLADYRPYLRDRLVDYVESLEFLFVPDSDEGGITKKFCFRGSSILGRAKEDKEREILFEELLKAYNLRSAIVHGDEIKENKIVKGKKLETFLKPLREYNRNAIKFFFKAYCLDDRNKRIELLNNIPLT